MTDRPCPSKCNARARKAWKDYESAVAAWRKAYDAFAAAHAAGTAEGDAPEVPAEPTIRIIYGDPVFCRRCTAKVKTALGEIDQAAGMLQAEIDGMRGVPGREKERVGKRGKASTTESPDNRVDGLDALYRMLAAAEDWWRGIRGHGPRPYMGEAGEQPLHAGAHPRSRTLGYLREHVGDILLHPDSPTFAANVLQAHEWLASETDSKPIPKRRAARCDVCGWRALYDRGDSHIECRTPDCPRVMTEGEYEVLLARQLNGSGHEHTDMQEAS